MASSAEAAEAAEDVVNSLHSEDCGAVNVSVVETVRVTGG